MGILDDLNFDCDNTISVDIKEKPVNADISKEENKYITDIVVGSYLIGIFIYIIIWWELYIHLDLSKWTFLMLYIGLGYFLVQLNDVINIDNVENRTLEKNKIEVVESYSISVASLALGISIFVILQKDSIIYKKLRASSIIALLGFIMVLVIPLSLFWVDSSASRIYINRHIKTISYQIGLFLIIAFFIEYIVLTYNDYIIEPQEKSEDRNKRIIETFRNVLAEIEVKGVEVL